MKSRRCAITRPDPATLGALAPGWAARCRLELALAGLFVVLVSASFHGFSLAAWHRILDGSPAEEVWAGEPREIRSDDWAVFIPTAFSQDTPRVGFRCRNPLVGDGSYDVLVNFALPCRSPITLFRPQLWGFFLGRDFGLGWLWWFNVLGLVYAFAALARRLVPGAGSEALWAAAFVAGSPFFPMWSYNSAHMAIFALGATVAAMRTLEASRPRAILGNALLSAYFAAAFAFVLYPPFQVALGHLCLVLGGVWLLGERAAVRSRFSRAHAAALLAAVALVGASVAWFWISHRGTIELVGGMEYPGRRDFRGGGLSLAHLLSNTLFVHGLARSHAAFGGNICESAQAPYLFPLFAVYVAARWLAARRAAPPLVLGLLGFSSALSVWMLWGFPAWIARVTLLNQLPDTRPAIAMVLAEGMLLCAVASSARAGSLFSAASAGDRFAATVAVACWLTLVGLQAPVIFARGGYGPAAMALAAALVAGVSVAWLRSARWALRVWIACAVASGIWFNPLVRGGAAYLDQNPVSAEIRRRDQAVSGRSVWVSLAPGPVGELFRAAGVRSLDGTHFYPQLGIWRKLDPEGTRLREYNRYAHVRFRAAPRGAPAVVRSTGFDSVSVEIDPCSPALGRLGVTHVVLPGGAAETPSCARLAEIADAGRFRIAAVR